MNKRKAILAGVTAAAVVLSSGVMAFAATDTAGTTESRSYQCKSGIRNNLTDDQMEAVMQARTDSMKEAAAQLVESGVITQEIADQLSQDHVMMKSRPADLASAEKQKTELVRNEKQKTGLSLTEEQRTALQEAVKTILESKLTALVDNGTLTQEQADLFLNVGGPARDGEPPHMGSGDKPGFGGHHHDGKEKPDSISESETQAL